MTENLFVITSSTFASLSKSSQDEIVRAMSGNPSVGRKAEPESALPLEEDEHFAELSVGQAREFYSGCGLKTRKAIEVMARSETNEFHVADVAKALDVEPEDLRGVWGGLTRRLQTITNDKGAYLINWELHEPVHDENDKYVDYIGVISELTHQSFRRLLVK